MTVISKDITAIKVALGKIEQHLSDMNGSLKTHSNHINDRCPDNRKDIYDKITSVRDMATRNTVIVVGIQTIVMGVIIAYFTGAFS